MSAVSPPGSAAQPGELEYVGFWIRVVAALVDTLWLSPVIIVLGLVYARLHGALDEAARTDPAGLTAASLTVALTPTPADLALNILLPAVLVVLFWLSRGATPGKMLFHARIVDAQSGAAPTPTQLVVRYVGYYVAALPFLLGIVWVGLDARKQGWHDKLAGTVVVRPKLRPMTTASFPARDRP